MKAGKWWAAAAGIAASLCVAAAPAEAGPNSTVAAGANGTSFFAWTEPGLPRYLHERSRVANGALTETQFVSPFGQTTYDHTIGSDAAGNAIIAWIGDGGEGLVVRARRRGADGSLGPLERISPVGASTSELRMAVEPDGDGMLVWKRLLAGKEVIQARRRSAGGVLGPLHTLSYAGADSEEPDVAVSASGAATVTWLRRAPNFGGTYVQTRTIAAGETLSDTQNLTPASYSAWDPRVTVGDSGTAVFAWSREGDGGSIAETRSRSASGAVSATRRLSADGASGFSVVTAGDRAGRTVFVWQQLVGSTYDLVGRVRQPGGALGPQFPLEAPTGVEPAVALDPNGNATIAWHTDDIPSVVHSRRRSVAGTLSPIRTLSDTSKDAGAPSLAVDAAGKATIAWYLPSSVALRARTVTAGGSVSPIQNIGAGASG